ncbi:mannosyltransferase family protein [Gordonia sp. ABSL1-1]|uniref:mannosyltransferase family protein n=1 Tax=Gordonia sp. ABSL1-1 TaxID=3053923 RepID=UPI0025743F7D|nr:mannosyltransferase family protein [Gordonia sp. ABSL1-1]MDL9937576.1 mannosyltransferase family protein [Gordonia sp. ABSL1-1]
MRDRIRTLHAHPHAWWVEAILVFLLIRLLGVLTLTRMATLHSETLRSRLAVWDGEWMLSIAAHGYGGVPATLTDAYGVHTADTAYAFFPGYPYLVGAVARLPLVSPFGAAIGVNVVLGCLAAVGAARLGHLCATQMSGRSPIGAADPRATGLFLVALFAATPMSVVLNMAYTEALFCALAVWALVGVLEGRWLLAGVMTLFAGTCRPTSVVLIGVVMLAAIIALVRRDEPRAWFAVILAPLGYLGYLSVVWAQTGSPTGWFEVQKDGWDTSLDFGVAAYRFVNDTLGDSDVVAHTATAMVILASIVMVGVAVWARMPWPVLVYGTLVVVSILISTGLMMSRPRLLLPAFVLLVPLAMALARVRRGLGVALLVPIVLGSSWFGAHMLTVFPNAI